MTHIILSATCCKYTRLVLHSHFVSYLFSYFCLSTSLTSVSSCPPSPGRDREELRRQGLPQRIGKRHPVMRVSLLTALGVFVDAGSAVTFGYINTALRLNKSLLLPSSTQAAECNQTRPDQEDQQTAHPHRRTGKNTPV